MSMLRARVAQVVLAVVSAFWVGVTATPMPHHCEMDAPATADAHAGGMAAHEGMHERHGSRPAPACHCVGHACCVAVAAPTPVASLAPVWSVRQADEAPVLRGRLASAPRHLLPPSLAPPAPLLS
jgi:hypothetical protein